VNIAPSSSVAAQPQAIYLLAGLYNNGVWEQVREPRAGKAHPLVRRSEASTSLLVAMVEIPEVPYACARPPSIV
jgi:hypothetical protein